MFKSALEELGFNIGVSTTPITPVIVGESRSAKLLSNRLFELGVFALPIIFPMVAKDQARIRTIMNAALSDEDVHFGIAAFAKAGRELKLI
jgi:glycine C-acetyltransferase